MSDRKNFIELEVSDGTTMAAFIAGLRLPENIQVL